MADANFVLSPEQMQEAALLYTEHEWPTSDIAEHFGVCKGSVANALLKVGVALRPKHQTPPVLRVKQCAACLHFLPVGMFSGSDAKRTKLASWCMSCTNNPRTKPWQTDPAPLTQALNHWRN